MDGWMDGLMDGWMDGWMDGLLDRWMVSQVCCQCRQTTVLMKQLL